MGGEGGHSRTATALALKRVAEFEPDAVDRYLISRGGKLWCDRVLEGVKRRDRTCMRLFGEAVKWVGAQTQVVALFLERAGVRSETELDALLASGKRLQRLTADSERSLEEYLDSALELASDVLRQRPELAGRVESWWGARSQAQVVETNGDKP